MVLLVQSKFIYDNNMFVERGKRLDSKRKKGLEAEKVGKKKVAENDNTKGNFFFNIIEM